MSRGLVLVAAFVVVACGGNTKRESATPSAAPLANQASPAQPEPVPASAPTKTGPPMSAAEAIGVLRTFESRFCACSDAACVQQVVDDMAKWQAQHEGQPIQWSEADTPYVTGIGQRIASCMQRATNGQPNPSTQP